MTPENQSSLVDDTSFFAFRGDAAEIPACGTRAKHVHQKATFSGAACSLCIM